MKDSLIQDIAYIIIASMLAGFVLALPKFELIDLLIFFGFSLFLFLVNYFSKFFAAKLLDCEINVSLWSEQRIRYWFGEGDYIKCPFPLWLVLPILVAIFSKWNIKLLTLLVFDVKGKKTYIGRKFAEVSEYDIARISMAGFIGVFLIALILKITGVIDLANICMWFIIANLLPLGELDGAKIFFSSRYLWIFIFCIMLASALLMNATSALVSVLLSLVLALLVVVWYYYKEE